ncbi:MAG: hypothetical protein GXO59_00910 [Dictyoglomi bacterium]|nr:hypothetical protein [Dictyoglomota bacterium]
MKAYMWVYMYIVLVHIVVAISALVFFYVPLYVSALFMFLSLVTFFYLWRREYEKIYLLHSANNILLCASAGVVFVKLVPDVSFVFGFVLAVVFIDIVSFTGWGKHLPNRKMAENVPLAKRLSASLPIPGIAEVYQITGMGDMFLSSVVVASAVKFFPAVAWIGVLSVVLGQTLNIFLVHVMRKRKNYVGVPAAPAVVFLYIFLLLIFHS